jgi:predicted NBD/HSP70 family sugar kinase
MWIGVEIGGTKLQVAVANGAGEIREIWRATVDTGRGGEGIRHCLAEEIPLLTARFSGDLGPLKGLASAMAGRSIRPQALPFVLTRSKVGKMFPWQDFWLM